MPQSSIPSVPGGRLQRLLAAAGTLLVTAHFSAKVVVRAACGRLRRATADRYARRWSSALLRLVRLRLEVHGTLPDLADGRRYLILSTHSSHFDIPVIFATLPGSIRMLAKRELFRIPLFGAALRATEFPAIDRRNARQARRDLEAARQLMERGIVVWAAPQGTRSADDRLLPFKKGCFQLALATGATIIPVAIQGIHRVLPAHSLRLNLGRAVRVMIGEPLDAGQFGADQLQLLMAEVRARLQGLLDQAEALDEARAGTPRAV